jgi:uncharacterized membrane protein YgaE (UPF0421/DUF939 family)
MEPAPAPIPTLTAFIYTSKAALAAVAAFLLCRLVTLATVNAAWAAISAVIVIQPFLHTSLRASVVRVQANFIAAIVGGALNACVGVPLLDLFLGIMAVGMVCHHLKMDDGLRAAYAATAIITLTMQGDHSWFGSISRVIAVLLGCLSALLVNVLFDHFSAQIAHKTSASAGVHESGE